MNELPKDSGLNSRVSQMRYFSDEVTKKDAEFKSPSSNQSMRKIIGVTAGVVSNDIQLTLLIDNKLETFSIARHILATLIANGAIALAQAPK